MFHPTHILAGGSGGIRLRLEHGWSFQATSAEELDARCQLVEAETELGWYACFRGVQGELSGKCEVMGLRIVEGVAQPMRHEKSQIGDPDHLS